MNMNRKYLILTLVILVVLVGFFFPKRVGGNLCGPECPSHGLHYFEQGCLGIKIRTTVIDAYWDTCYGLPVGEKKCYGVPYTETENFEDRELDCNYPCNDENIKTICQQQKNITFGGVTYSCEGINRKCRW